MPRKQGKKKAPPRCDFTAPEDVLRAFMCEMNDWERRAREEWDRHAGASWNPIQQMHAFWQELASIFDRYCTPVETRKGKGREDRRGKVQYRSVGMVPTYDPDCEKVLAVMPRPRTGARPFVLIGGPASRPLSRRPTDPVRRKTERARTFRLTLLESTLWC